MLIIDKMKTMDLTPVEQHVASFIIEHVNEIDTMSTRDIGKAVYCSSSAVVR